MPQQLRVTRKLDASGATLIGFNPLVGAGKVFYVDYELGNDGDYGTDPNRPLKLIQTAVDATRTKKNDYIFILNSKDGDAAAPVNFGSDNDADQKERIHLIGLSNPQATGGVVMKTTTETDSCIALGNVGGQYCEIAGISFGGGTTAPAAGIELSQTLGLWIHHCNFGHSFCGDTPYNGIRSDATNSEGLLVEDCFFWGDQDNATGKITQDGISLQSATPCKNAIIRRNVFMSLGAVALHADLIGGMILNNTFKLPANTAGAAITLLAASVGCWIDGNSANYGGTDAMAAEAYKDDASGGVDANTWGLNYTGGALDFPAA